MGDPGKGKPHQHDGSGRTRPREAARNGLDADAEQRVLQDDLTTGNSSLAGCRVRGEEGERQVRAGVGVDTKSSVRALTASKLGQSWIPSGSAVNFPTGVLAAGCRKPHPPVFELICSPELKP